MNMRLNRLLDEIQKTEEKIALWQEHLRELNIRRKQMEDAEIVKSVRSMRLDSRNMLSLLEGIQNGTVTIQHRKEDTISPDMEITENNMVTEGTAPESEDLRNENEA